MFPYQQLAVWRDAHAFALAAYRHASRIPDSAFRWQVQRAAQSIPTNLVEGASSQSQADFARYVGIAMASAKETDYHLMFAQDSGLLDPAACSELRATLDRLLPRLAALRRTIRLNAERRAKPRRA